MSRRSRRRRSRAPRPGVLPSRELGLALGLIVGRHFFGVEDLHYGLWPEEGLALELRNLPQAQTRYTDLLLARIPDGVRTILDVGCGAGHTAARLLQRGYQVDCLSPNPTLNQMVRERLGDQVNLYECRFEDFQTERRYDLILFSECLLFIHLVPGLTRALELLEPGGHALISDIFRTTPERGPIGGGHPLGAFEEAVAALPWEVVSEDDITAGISRTFDVLSSSMVALRPAWELIKTQLSNRYPVWSRLLRWKLADTIERYERKHFGGERDGAAFRRHKAYRVVLLRKQDSAP